MEMGLFGQFGFLLKHQYPKQVTKIRDHREFIPMASTFSYIYIPNLPYKNQLPGDSSNATKLYPLFGGHDSTSPLNNWSRKLRSPAELPGRCCLSFRFPSDLKQTLNFAEFLLGCPRKLGNG